MKAARSVRSSCSGMWTKRSPQACRAIAPRWKGPSNVLCWSWAWAIQYWRRVACWFRSWAASSFPPAERNQLLVDIEAPSTDSLTSLQGDGGPGRSTHQSAMRRSSARRYLPAEPRRRFYYNVEPKEPANYLAQILINTRHEDDVEPLLVKLRQELDSSVPGAALRRQTARTGTAGQGTDSNPPQRREPR